MNLNINQNVGISAQWCMEVCTPTPTGTLTEFPFGSGFRNNAILNYFLSGIMLHLHNGRDPHMFHPAWFTDGAMQIGTGTKPITYTDSSLDKFYQESTYVRPLANRINITYITGSGMAIFEKTYEFPSSPGSVKYTEAGFRQIDSAGAWSAYRINPIYSRFLFTEEAPITGYISGILNENGEFRTLEHQLDKVSGVFSTIIVSGNPKIIIQEINPKKIIRQNITGFISGYLSFLNQFTPFTGNNSSSGFFLSGQQYIFPPKPMLFSEEITGYISGNMTELYGFIPYTDPEIASSGYYLSGLQYKFIDPFNEFNNLNGFENGYTYYGFNFQYGSGFINNIPNETYGDGKITGVIGLRNIFSNNTGLFSGFSGMSGFDNKVGHKVFDTFFLTGSGFGSGFVQDSGQPIFGLLKFGTGKMTGIIGYRNLFQENIYSGLSGISTHEYGWYFISSGMFGVSGMNIISGKYSGLYSSMTGFSGEASNGIDTFGILTGIIGYKKYISPITLNLGQYIKMKYRIAFRVPQYAQLSQVTGEDLVYGDFNGSGQLKFLGKMSRAFGEIRENDLDTNNGTAYVGGGNHGGLWWPVINPCCGGGYPYPSIGLSAAMLDPYEALDINPAFPPVDNSLYFFTLTGAPETKETQGYRYYMKDPWNYYPSKNYNTLYGTYTGGYSLINTFIFKAEFPDYDADIGGIWLSYASYGYNKNTQAWTYYKPMSGDVVGWLYKFNTPQKKWEDQSLFLTTRFSIEKDQLFEDPYYGRYPQ